MKQLLLKLCHYVISGSLRRGTESDQAVSETCQTQPRCVGNIMYSGVIGFEADDVRLWVSVCRRFLHDHCKVCTSVANILLIRVCFAY